MSIVNQGLCGAMANDIVSDGKNYIEMRTSWIVFVFGVSKAVCWYCWLHWSILHLFSSVLWRAEADFFQAILFHAQGASKVHKLPHSHSDNCGHYLSITVTLARPNMPPLSSVSPSPSFPLCLASNHHHPPPPLCPSRRCPSWNIGWRWQNTSWRSVYRTRWRLTRKPFQTRRAGRRPPRTEPRRFADPNRPRGDAWDAAETNVAEMVACNSAERASLFCWWSVFAVGDVSPLACAQHVCLLAVCFGQACTEWQVLAALNHRNANIKVAASFT